MQKGMIINCYWIVIAVLKFPENMLHILNILNVGSASEIKPASINGLLDKYKRSKRCSLVHDGK